jgi:hypothetical protein
MFLIYLLLILFHDAPGMSAVVTWALSIANVPSVASVPVTVYFSVIFLVCLLLLLGFFLLVTSLVLLASLLLFLFCDVPGKSAVNGVS